MQVGLKMQPEGSGYSQKNSSTGLYNAILSGFHFVEHKLRRKALYFFRIEGRGREGQKDSGCYFEGVIS